MFCMIARSSKESWMVEHSCIPDIARQVAQKRCVVTWYLFRINISHGLLSCLIICCYCSITGINSMNFHMITNTGFSENNFATFFTFKRFFSRMNTKMVIKWLRWLNWRPQSSHLKGRSPKWKKWRFLVLALFIQWCALRHPEPLPVWVRMCSLRVLNLVNIFSHSPHL